MGRPTESLALLTSARRLAYVFAGGSARCAFQVGVIETLRELGLRPALVVAASAGVWNAAAVAAGTDRRLRLYWRAFARLPPLDLRNLLRQEHSPFRYRELHRRTFTRYVGAERMRRPGVLPAWIAVTRLRDLALTFFDARQVEDPLTLLLAANYLPPYYTLPLRIGGEAYVDAGLVNNVPYEKAFEEGCDAAVVVSMKGESEGGFYRSPRDPRHVIPSPYRERTVVVRPRFPLPLSFVERRWPVLERTMEIGRLRAREILLGESHPETQTRGRSVSRALRLLLKATATGPRG